jgi:cobalt-zinc-cadmium efflux system membrane fusion protein
VYGLAAALVVPRAALLSDEGRSFVFVRRQGEYWVRRPVETGRTAGDRVEVTKGLAGGETVATEGCFLLKSDVLRSKMGAGCAD